MPSVSMISTNTWLRAALLRVRARVPRVVEPRGFLVYTEESHGNPKMTDIPESSQAEDIPKQNTNSTLHLGPSYLQLHTTYLLADAVHTPPPTEPLVASVADELW